MAQRIRELDDCVGKFYEDNLEEKTKAAKKILELFQNFNNLD